MEQAQVSVVMVPLPFQSHLNQLLRLAALISSHNLPVHFLGSATHNRQVKLRYGLKPNPISNIQFHDLPTPPIDSPDPTVSAYLALRRPIGELIKEMSISKTKIVVIYDRLMAKAVCDAVSITNVESYAFNCLSGFDLFHILWEALEKPFALEGEPVENMCSIRDVFPEELIQFMASKPEHFKDRAGDIHNTIRLIDGKYIDLLGREEIGGKTQQWAISSTLKSKLNINHDTRTRHGCLDWLDRQAPGSVIYASFGTSISFSEDETREIALGLEQSKRKFVWVLRDADRADIFSGEDRKIDLLDGFEERVRENGIVVRDWAPQVEILAHKSTGGFMSHCGWNSCIESLITGVPMLAWPMHSDQPFNAVFMTDVLKTGLVVRKWADREKLVKASVIKDVIERLMGSEEGDKVRNRAAELSAAVGKATEEGGELSREMESFIAHISR
ncbi:zeatin o-glucosyltransferase [Phtheirospermum japonicum]|uniref:Glycosyltransferase n=1 Tax=Phtheirospermum japonicum TaxID=374723 RepID=A0A830BW23_9LAMI|nr:zeatin o-glucosyltransferase [Phtheirospermum japonicum]